MTLSEFKAWFEGYTEDLGGAPSDKQFARIKAQVAKIDGVAITPVVYRDVYWPRVQPYYERMWHDWSSAGGTRSPLAGTDMLTASSAMATVKMADEPLFSETGLHMFDAGKADAMMDA